MWVTHAVSGAWTSNCRTKVLSTTAGGLPPQEPGAYSRSGSWARLESGCGGCTGTGTWHAHRTAGAARHERIPHFASSATYADVLDVALFGDPYQFALEPPVCLRLFIALIHRARINGRSPPDAL